VHCPSTTSQYSSKLALSQAASPSPNSLDYGLQTRSITASKCISKLTQLWHPSSHNHCLHVHLHTLDYWLQVLLLTRSIMACKCISKLGWSQLSSVSPNRPNYSLQVHLQTCSITASNWIAKLTPSRPPSASPNSLDHSPGVYPWVHSIVIFRHTLNYSHALPSASPDIMYVDG
jgi:hypothetical protein